MCEDECMRLSDVERGKFREGGRGRVEYVRYFLQREISLSNFCIYVKDPTIGDNELGAFVVSFCH